MSNENDIRCKAICFDMDGTLSREKTNVFFAETLGVLDQVLEIEDKLMNGEIDSSEFMVVVSEIMNELSVDHVLKHFDELPVIDGISETVEYLSNKGIESIIVTTSNKFFADCFKDKYGFTKTFGTIHKVNQNGLIGVGTKVCSSKHKPIFIENYCTSLNISMEQVAAVGDSLSDIYLFQRVGRSIAINYDNHLLGKADHYIHCDNLTEIINLLEA